MKKLTSATPHEASPTTSTNAPKIRALLLSHSKHTQISPP